MRPGYPETAPKRGYRLMLSANGIASGPDNQATGDMDKRPAASAPAEV